MMTKTATAIAVSPPSSPALATVAAAARVRARFFGFKPASRTPKPNDLPGVKRSMAAIHFGTVGSTPGCGRACHCFHAITRNSRPSSNSTTATAVDVPESASSASLATSRTMTLTTTRARIQPTAKATPLERAFGVPSMRMMAMIGTGLMATPIADGEQIPDRLSHCAGA